MINLSEIGLLINLARADGEISSEEVEYLMNIGEANNIPGEKIIQMLQNEQKEKVKYNLSEDERLDLLIMLTQLMKSDGKLFKQEIRYCAKIASKLGYEEEVLFDLMLNITSGKMASDDVDSIKRKAREFLK